MRPEEKEIRWVGNPVSSKMEAVEELFEMVSKCLGLVVIGSKTAGVISWLEGTMGN